MVTSDFNSKYHARVKVQSSYFW